MNRPSAFKWWLISNKLVVAPHYFNDENFKAEGYQNKQAHGTLKRFRLLQGTFL